MPHGAIEWVEIPAPNPGQSADFYRNVFGWKIDTMDQMPDYPMFSSGTLSGGFTKGPRPAPEAGVLVFVTVDSIEEIVPRITGQGGQAAQPKTVISPEIGWWASFRDPAGNLIGLYEKTAQNKS